MTMNQLTKTHIAILIGLVALTPLLWDKFRKQPLPIYGQVQSFHLTNSRQEPVDDNTLKGKIWVADCIFTTCTGPCPLMTEKMAQLQRSFALEKNVRMVTVTVNPEYDTPDVLAEYGKKYNADANLWYFLTGSRDEISRLVKEDFRMGDLQDIASHSTYFVLVDELLRIRGYYDMTDDKEMRRLVVDTAYLLKHPAKK